MQGKVKLRLGRHLVGLPRFVVRRAIAAEAKRMAKTIGFMTSDHHAVRNFAVTELAATGKPVAVEQFARALGITEQRVTAILDELEPRMVFVWRPDRQHVAWAYPVTSDVTPHRIEYASAPPTYGA